MLDHDRLRAFAPSAWDGYLQALVEGAPELDAAGINTPLRLAHFLAQCAHETGGLTIVRENTGWTPAQMCRLWPSRFKSRLDPRIVACRGNPEALANLAYSNRSDLGNTGGDDGWAYRGASFLQSTGRANFREIGDAIGIDLEGQPELIEEPGIGLRAALYIWDRARLNGFADANYGRAIGNAINRGSPYSRYEPIGAPERQRWIDRAWSIFGDGRVPDPDTLELGAYGSRVVQLQGALKALGYGVGDSDGVYGPTLARAVAAFKADHKRDFGVRLEPDDTVGPLTVAALHTSNPVLVSDERRSATAAELAEKGSVEVKAGLSAKKTGTAMVALGAAKGAQESGILDSTVNGMQQMTVLHSTVAPALDAARWAISHIGWVIIIGAGIWYWQTGHNVVMARLKAHTEGWNLFR